MADLEQRDKRRGLSEHPARLSPLQSPSTALTPFVHRLQLLLVSRFLLNLRRTQAVPVTSRPSQFTLTGFDVPTLPDMAEDKDQYLDAEQHKRGGTLCETYVGLQHGQLMSNSIFVSVSKQLGDEFQGGNAVSLC